MPLVDEASCRTLHFVVHVNFLTTSTFEDQDMGDHDFYKKSLIYFAKDAVSS